MITKKGFFIIMYKSICLTLPLLLCASLAHAEISTETENYKGNLLKYPVISLKKAGIAAKINKDVAKQIALLKNDLKDNKGYADKISMSYKVLCDTDQKLNILLYSWTYMNGAAHGMYFTTGLSYDLKTGQKALTEKLLANATAAELDSGIRIGRYTLTNSSQLEMQLNDFWKVESISKECILNPDGSLMLIYQPYDLAPYAYGNTFINIPAKELPYLSGKSKTVSNLIDG